MLIPQPLHGASLAPAERDDVWAFMQRFARLARAEFEQDLADCDLVYLFRDDERVLRGLISLRIHHDREARPRRTILLGYWTILDPSLRGEGFPQRCLIDGFLRCKRRAPIRPVWCVFTSASFRSYLMVSRTTAIYWPRRGRTMPARVIGLRDRVMAAVEGRGYDPVRGIVAGSGVLEYAGTDFTDDPRAADDPDVAAWLQWNAGFRRGDQLVVVIPMSLYNFVASGWRMISRRGRRTFAALLRSRGAGPRSRR